MAAARKTATRKTETARAKAASKRPAARKVAPKPATSKPAVKIAPVVLSGPGIVETDAGRIVFGRVPANSTPLGAVLGMTFDRARAALIEALGADGAEAADLIQSVVGSQGEESETVRAVFDARFPDAPAGFYGAVVRCLTAGGQIGSGGGKLWPASRTLTDAMLWPEGEPSPRRVWPGSWAAAVVDLARRAPSGEVLPFTSLPEDARTALHYATGKGWVASDACPVRGPKYRGYRLAVE